MSAIVLPEAIERWPIDRLRPYDRNPRQHSDGQIERIVASIREFGWTNPILVHGDTIVAGHARLEAAKRLGLETVPVVRLDHLTPEQARAYVIADNQLALGSEWDEELLAEELKALEAAQFDLEPIGFEEDELDRILSGSGARPPDADGDGRQVRSLAERFGVPPFSVLDARAGWWRERKRSWLALGIRGEDGRAEALTYIGRSGGNLDPVSAKIAATAPATSVFDPVLCELAYRWFCPPGGIVLDPFAGGSVRGVVASRMGRRYVGVELRPEQVAANRAQADEICGDPMPVWIEGDARHIPELCADVDADFVFSCPPYFDLEVYSDDPRDLSACDADAFVSAYRGIVAAAVGRLKPDRFCAFVVGDVRDSEGFYRGLPRLTIEAFEAAGARLYNDAVYLTPTGSLRLRAARQFVSSRKLGRAHQYLLVFCKGDPARATAAVGDVEFADPADDAAGD